MTPINQSRESVPTFSRSESDPTTRTIPKQISENSGESISETEIKKSTSFLVTIEDEPTTITDTVEVTSISVPLNPIVVYMPMPETVRTFHAPDIVKKIASEQKNSEKIPQEKIVLEENKEEKVVEKVEEKAVEKVEEKVEDSNGKSVGIEFTVDFPKQFVIDFNELQMDKKLGQGSFGIGRNGKCLGIDSLVYQMKWRKRKCAVKQILDLELSEERFKEFQKEALLMM
jgi:hypothetical protein